MSLGWGNTADGNNPDSAPPRSCGGRRGAERWPCSTALELPSRWGATGCELEGTGPGTKPPPPFQISSLSSDGTYEVAAADAKLLATGARSSRDVEGTSSATTTSSALSNVMGADDDDVGSSALLRRLGDVSSPSARAINGTMPSRMPSSLMLLPVVATAEGAASVGATSVRSPSDRGIVNSNASTSDRARPAGSVGPAESGSSGAERRGASQVTDRSNDTAGVGNTAFTPPVALFRLSVPDDDDDDETAAAAVAIAVLGAAAAAICGASEFGGFVVGSATRGEERLLLTGGGPVLVVVALLLNPPPPVGAAPVDDGIAASTSRISAARSSARALAALGHSWLATGGGTKHVLLLTDAVRGEATPPGLGPPDTTTTGAGGPGLGGAEVAGSTARGGRDVPSKRSPTEGAATSGLLRSDGGESVPRANDSSGMAVPRDADLVCAAMALLLAAMATERRWETAAGSGDRALAASGGDVVAAAVSEEQEGGLAWGDPPRAAAVTGDENPTNIRLDAASVVTLACTSARSRALSRHAASTRRGTDSGALAFAKT